ncbi:zona pellucida sperm-binding protein 3-like [Echeneis naucrates]|uniref:zona pellucida sperm-binding protein 3-like n=1 Tax=Echeneis naucrates TaxID=173247 RepID=UPI0011140CC5|nr:zona pellucida sperm-binding protein 3-like [Echeneis naucrates]
MDSRKLLVCGVVLLCVRFSDTRVISGRKPTHWGVEVRKPAQVEAPAEPERRHSRLSDLHAGGFQVKLWPSAEPLSWRFPEDPVDSVKKLPVRFERRQPDTTNRVAVRCGESRIQVEVSQDLLGLGWLVEPNQVTLGGCPVTDVDGWAHVLVFESELHNCNSMFAMTETAFIYGFALVYNPKVLTGSPITRNQRVVIGVECHYPR